MTQLSHPYTTTGKTIASTRQTCVGWGMHMKFQAILKCTLAFFFCHVLLGLPYAHLVFREQKKCGKSYLRLYITMSFLQSLHKVSEWSVIHPRLEWQPWSCTDVGFPHPFPIKSAILAGKVKWFCFSYLSELITSGSKAAGFAVNPRLTKLLFFLPIW